MANFREFIKNQVYTDNDMYSYKTDEELFEEMADFIIALEPDQLSEEQIEKILDILEELEIDSHIQDFEDEDEDEDELDEKRLAKRTKVKDRLKARKYYKRYKSKIKKKKKRFMRSATGKLRKKKSERMAKSGRTATGRKKVKYRK